MWLMIQIKWQQHLILLLILQKFRLPGLNYCVTRLNINAPILTLTVCRFQFTAWFLFNDSKRGVKWFTISYRYQITTHYWRRLRWFKVKNALQAFPFQAVPGKSNLGGVFRKNPWLNISQLTCECLGIIGAVSRSCSERAQPGCSISAAAKWLNLKIWFDSPL